MKPISLVIANINIRQDEEGRFCLNDLHKAAGSHPKHQPANFLRLDSTKALIEEIRHSSDLRSAIEVINGGHQRGTYGCKALTYAYGMWISAEFYLHVISAYDALVTGQLQPAVPASEYTKLLQQHCNLQVDYIALLKVPSALPVPFGTRRFWTADEDRELLALHAQGLGHTRIGFKLGRGGDSVRHRLERLGKQGLNSSNQTELFGGEQ